jgi:uncharacterized ferritin-like protein (DUF455 family)
VRFAALGHPVHRKTQAITPPHMPQHLAERTLHCLLLADPDAKIAALNALHADWQKGIVPFVDSIEPAQIIATPGRPEKPALVPPQKVARRSAGTRAGHAALIHALAHIEFNAINLALDAAYRFRELSRDYYTDWLQVAFEEAYHFNLLRGHLRTLGYDYGSFSAHDGLWEMAVKTAHDPLHRMALVPRLLEARGLDASPAIITKLRNMVPPDRARLFIRKRGGRQDLARWSCVIWKPVATNGARSATLPGLIFQEFLTYISSLK